MNPGGGVVATADTEQPQACQPQACQEPQACAGQERDGETSLDFFGARYFAAGWGRFSSPDVPFADQQVQDPQSWNMFTYVRDNPLSLTDPTGNTCVVNVKTNTEEDDGGPGQTCAEARQAQLFTFDGSTNTLSDNSNGEVSAPVQLFFNQMSARRETSENAILVSAGLSVAGGIALGSGAVVAVIDGVAYTWESLLALGPNALARLAAAGKITQELWGKIQPYLGGGAEISFGKGKLIERINILGDWRQIPGRIYTWAERLPHYHRRFPGPGGSINRHRPWDAPGKDRAGNPLSWWKKL